MTECFFVRWRTFRSSNLSSENGNVGDKPLREVAHWRESQCYSSRRMKTLNEAFTKLSMRRRYEVWFLRVGLGDRSGAWWFRYLLMNPGRGGCAGDRQGQPMQVWATWFPREGKPETWIQGFPVETLRLSVSKRGASPFFLEIGENRIAENECRGWIEAKGQRISWDLRYRSSFLLLLSSKPSISTLRTSPSHRHFALVIRWL